jgi:hypothetical protein
MLSVITGRCNRRAIAASYGRPYTSASALALMIRRGITTFVLLGYLAGQLAMAPHAHAGGAGHDESTWQPHVHLSKSGGDGPCRHHHGNCHHGHDHHHAHDDHCLEECDHGQSETAPIGKTLNTSSNHDADAVYIASFEQTAPRNEQSILARLGAASEQAALVSAIDRIEVPPLAGTTVVQSVTGASAPRCALYLALRTLRI